MTHHVKNVASGKKENIIMNDSLADRYFSIIQKQIKDEQTYLATIQRQHDLRRGGKPLIRQTL